MRCCKQFRRVVKKRPRVVGWFAYYPLRIYGQPRFALGCQHVEVVEVAVQHDQLRLGGYEFGEERLGPLDQGRGQGTGPSPEVAPQSLHTLCPLGDGRERVVRRHGTPQLLQNTRSDRRSLPVVSDAGERHAGLQALQEHRAPLEVELEQPGGPAPAEEPQRSASALKSEFGKESFSTAGVPSARRAGAT